MHLRNVSLLKQDYTVQYPRRLSSLYTSHASRMDIFFLSGGALTASILLELASVNRRTHIYSFTWWHYSSRLETNFLYLGTVFQGARCNFVSTYKSVHSTCKMACMLKVRFRYKINYEDILTTFCSISISK
jgi:hypothetical protein